MSKTSIQDLLPLVEQPSRYLGFETNTIVKDKEAVKLSFALAFPDLYEIGTSHFGIQILYSLLNEHKDIAAERIYTPALDMEKALRENDLPLFSLESHRPAAEFDIIGFSILYELNYTNILTMLDLAGIPFLAADRDLSHPLIIGGGPCSCNPEPVADFFDAIVVGDGEKAVLEISEAWIAWKESGGEDREALLRTLSSIDGVYVPAFFVPGEDGALVPTVEGYDRVRRAVVADLDAESFPEKPIVAFGKPVHDRLRLEVGRGCSRGCRFCQAGMVYRPVRERSVPGLLEITETSLAATGYDDISLLSLSTGDYGCLNPLMENLMGRYGKSHTAVSLPSIRAGRLTPTLMNQIKKVRKTGFTIAPEAGTQRLRDVINKGITEQEIVDTVESAFTLGWKVIKLYFMIGLPTETEEDLAGIVALVDKLRKVKGEKGRRGKINVSVTTFIPKAQTPFQWEPQLSFSESMGKIKWLRDRLSLPGVQFKWQDPRLSMLEGLWARGGRELSALLIAAYEQGCKFDGWSDHFSMPRWEAAFAEIGTDPESAVTRRRDLDEALPWDHIDARISKEFLKKEWENALGEALTPDCRFGKCSKCGVCDFKVLSPKLFDPAEIPAHTGGGANTDDGFTKKLRVSYAKEGDARYFGHLEMVKIFIRAIKRADIPVCYSGGFHPMVKISFDDPLPLGMESLGEFFNLSVPGEVKPHGLVDALNAELPRGLRATGCAIAPGKASRKVPTSAAYLVRPGGAAFDGGALEAFKAMEAFTFERTNKKGKIRVIDLREMVLEIDLLDSGALQMVLKIEPGKTVRPHEVLTRIFSLPEGEVNTTRVVKVGTD